ncbi:hypothetical protein ACKKBG_A05925 [Auxenochlorella protothecoides x Auxenochlorella symbiontica]
MPPGAAQGSRCDGAATNPQRSLLSLVSGLRDSSGHLVLVVDDVTLLAGTFDHALAWASFLHALQTLPGCQQQTTVLGLSALEGAACPWADSLEHASDVVLEVGPRPSVGTQDRAIGIDGFWRRDTGSLAADALAVLAGKHQDTGARSRVSLLLQDNGLLRATL